VLDDLEKGFPVMAGGLRKSSLIVPSETSCEFLFSVGALVSRLRHGQMKNETLEAILFNNTFVKHKQHEDEKAKAGAAAVAVGPDPARNPVITLKTIEMYHKLMEEHYKLGDNDHKRGRKEDTPPPAAPKTCAVGTCKKKLTDKTFHLSKKAMQCDTCNKWFAIECIKMVFFSDLF